MSSKSAYGEPSNFQLAGPLAHFSLARSLLGKGLTAGLVSLCLGSVSFADDWNVQGIVSGEILYDDNIRLDAEDNREISTFGGVVTPEFELTGAGPRWDTLVNLRLDAAGFESSRSLNYFEQFLFADANYRTQLSLFGISFDGSHQTTLTSEEDDTGELDDDGRRLSGEVTPFWQYTFTERHRFNVDAGYRKVHYYDIQFDDFSTYRGSVGWRHDLTEKDEIGASVAGGHFVNDDEDGNRTSSVSLRGFWERQHSERLLTTLEAGPGYVWSRDRFRTAGGGREVENDETLGLYVSGAVDWAADERTDLNFSARHSLDGSGAGNARQRSVVRLRARHEFLPNIDISFNGRYVRDQEAAGSSSALRDFISAAPTLRWRFAQNMDLGLGYQLRFQDRDRVGQATSHRVLLTFTYNTPSWGIDF